jgi:DNA-binding response OmpR family regulator
MKTMSEGETYRPMDCPCCGQQVDAPNLSIMIEAYKLQPIEAKILTAVWRGNGHAVSTERILDVMYSDDRHGGPSSPHSLFKSYLSRLRARLAGSGVGIETVGYRGGYRLVIGKAAS